MTRTALAKAIRQLSEYQIDKLQKMVLEYSLLNHELEAVRPETCPKCGADEHSLIKKGFSRGKQRFQCKCCQKKFTYDSQQITFYSHQPTEAWIRALEATLRLDSLKETARLVGVCRSTAFYMRHRLLAFMEKALDSGDVLDGLVEADETYVPESQKGRKVTHRKARLHGEGANLRGISHEQLCVCVATDRNHHVAAKCVNRGRPTCEQIETALITPSRGEKFCGHSYTAEEARQLLAAVEGDPVEPAVYLGLYLGLRRSEVAGLRWMDVDFDNNQVHIRNTIVRFSTVSEQEKTKSKASRRDLFLPTGLKTYLLSLKEKQKANHSFLEVPFGEESHICQWTDGKPYQPDYISSRFRVILKRRNLPIIRFHDLRHTAGSLLINQGQSVKQVQEFLGHEQASATLDIYTHLNQESRMDTALTIDSILTAAG